MIRNYLKIAIRNLVRNKVYSFINIFGLSVGLATCLLIMLYIFDEISYDKHHRDVSQLYRVAQQIKDEKWAGTVAPIAQGLRNDFAEIEQVARILKFPNIDKMLLKNDKNQQQFYENNGMYADANFFEIFTYDFKFGDSQTALNQPNTMVISEDVAQKLFGNESPINKVVSVEIPYGKTNYSVKGVFKNTQNKSHINAHYFLSMENDDLGQWVKNQTNWSNNSIFHTYLKLKKGTNPTAFEAKLPSFYQRNGGVDMKAAGVTKSLFLQPLQDIYLRSAIGNEISTNSSMTYLYILGSIAAFLLLIACINFMNLSTARSEKRAKEVGVRKVMGANKNGLIGQFLGESLMMCLIALVVSLITLTLFLPVFNSFSQKNIILFQKPILVLWIAGLTAITGLLSGLYPALYLSSFKSISVLKGKLFNSISVVFIRKGLVVFQFAISVTLILAAIVIWQQLDLIRNKDLGFNKNQQLILPFQSRTSANNYVALKNEITQNTKIISATAGTSYPSIELMEDHLFYAEGKTLDDKVDIGFVRANEGYLETLGYKLLYGRSLSKNMTADSNTIILNETAIKQLGYESETAVGKMIYFEADNQRFSKQIVGVMKDFNFRSLHSDITPYGIVRLGSNEQPNYFIANLQRGDFASTIAEVEKIWEKINPETPFEYFFLDQEFQKVYEKEARTAGIIFYFTLITIFIACLGLFGLATFTAEQRTKEIGIRKVLGASILQITILISKDFLKLVMIAFVIASPIAYYFMDKWLADFAYRITISWWVFALAGVATISIALITVSWHSIKAALANPVKSLKTE
ncbi:MAG: ABC transporter permease [Cytophagia bacterium]|nr:MAG: ABC transporter permease [Cytophagales bacterium]TAG38690.1 MAG: ABC transporter permease [Cytophagia bacterium]